MMGWEFWNAFLTVCGTVSGSFATIMMIVMACDELNDKYEFFALLLAAGITSTMTVLIFFFGIWFYIVLLLLFVGKLLWYISQKIIIFNSGCLRELKRTVDNGNFPTTK